MALLVFQGDMVAIPWFSEVGSCARDGSLMNIIPGLPGSYRFPWEDLISLCLVPRIKPKQCFRDAGWVSPP